MWKSAKKQSKTTQNVKKVSKVQKNTTWKSAKNQNQQKKCIKLPNNEV